MREINDREPQIVIKDTTEGDKILVAIKDNGRGISEEMMHSLWLPTSSPKTGRINLGLPIAKSIIESMGGSINVRSVLNKYTEFTITINKTHG